MGYPPVGMRRRIARGAVKNVGQRAMIDEIGSIDKPLAHPFQRGNQQIDKRLTIDNDIGVHRHPAHQHALFLVRVGKPGGTRTLAGSSSALPERDQRRMGINVYLIEIGQRRLHRTVFVHGRVEAQLNLIAFRHAPHPVAGTYRYPPSSPRYFYGSPPPPRYFA